MSRRPSSSRVPGRAAGGGLAGAFAVALVGAAQAAGATSADRARAGDFDASGPVACAMNPGEAMGTCTAHVARGAGEVTAVVAFGNGFRRTLFFEGGAFVAGDATMSGTGRDTEWQARDGLHLIRVDDQKFEIPDALLFGE